ncbi:MAG: putative TetR-family transcriptional regulator [Cryobacterium sp.]|nr:putative TetR-family transcriptional regulator [Cryobacterium sp.]
MRTDGEATRSRILEAARTEFAEFGLAGARVDRIASVASASKERLYAYFGDKRSLYAAVLQRNLDEVVEAIPLDVSDLAGFVGSVFDHSLRHPEHMRMLDWARLEGDLGLIPTATSARTDREEAAIAAAQEQGLIDPQWNPRDLVTMLFGLATAWTHTPSGLLDTTADTTDAGHARRRGAAVAAARKLLAPPR